MANALKVEGLKEFNRDVAKAERETKKVVRDRLKEVGDFVRVDAAGKLSQYDAYSASKLRVRVRQAGIFVEQSLRRTTGTRPDFGALQVTKALLPALAENEGELNEKMEKAADDLADVVEGKRLGL